MIQILLLITMISCVCAGTLDVNVTQTHYQAEEDDNVTLEWTFTTRRDKSPNLLLITCDRSINNRGSTVLHLEYGVEVPKSQDKQFLGRVQWDRDVLREGRLRLHVSRLRTEDSGRYKCVVQTRHGQDDDQCWLNVTASVAQEQHTTPTVNPEPKGQERFYISLGAGIMTAGIILVGTAAAAVKKVANVGIRVIVVIAAVVVIVVVYSVTVATATAPEAAVLGLLLGGSIILSVFAALSAPWLLIYYGFCQSNPESRPDSISSTEGHKMTPD